MNKSFITLIGIVVLSTGVSAIAGPDFQAIEQARKLRQASASPATNLEKSTASQQLQLLDHGPRALASPYANQQKKLLAVN